MSAMTETEAFQKARELYDTLEAEVSEYLIEDETFHRWLVTALAEVIRDTTSIKLNCAQGKTLAIVILARAFIFYDDAETNIRKIVQATPINQLD